MKKQMHIYLVFIIIVEVTSSYELTVLLKKLVCQLKNSRLILETVRLNVYNVFYLVYFR